MALNVEHLGEFMAVVDCGSMTQAARRLHCTQSALSKHVAALERELGVSLLERAPHGIAPTRPGRLLYGHAARIRRAMADIYRSVGAEGAGASAAAAAQLDDGAFEERCARLGRSCSMTADETRALTLYLLDAPVDEVAAAMGTSRCDAAELIGSAYRKTKTRDKQRLYELVTAG